MLIVIGLIGGLGLFLFGMTVMSEGLQKVAGSRLRSAIGAITNNRFAGVLTGFGVTAIIQSSSATTVMLVSFVNAGLMNLQQSIGVIMGANIGTTVTGWLVALLGFKVKIQLVALVAVGIGFFMRLIGKKNIPYWGEVLLGFGLIFIGLDFMKDSMGDMKNSETISAWLSYFNAEHIGQWLVVVAIGTLVTVVIQSSSATMALTMTLAAQGLITFPTAAALILGENIGTTITANLAAIGASRNAKRTAFAHFVFNLSGVVWMMFVFKWFVLLVDAIVPGDPTSALAIPGHMAAFHTLFNISNTLIFLPFVPLLAKFANKVIPKKASQEQDSLKYIEAPIMPTPALAVESSRQELYKMGNYINEMMDDINQILDNPHEFSQALGDDIRKLEEATDIQKKTITAFLSQALQRNFTKDLGKEISNILAHVTDFERIGDHLRSVQSLIGRAFEEGHPLSLEAYEDLVAVANKCKDFLALIQTSLQKPNAEVAEKGRVFEDAINQMRARGRESHKQRLIDNHCNVASGLVFLEILVHFEKIGDHSYNIAQRITEMAKR